MWYHLCQNPDTSRCVVEQRTARKVFHPNLSDRVGQQMHNYVYSVAPNIIYGEPSNAFEGAAGVVLTKLPWTLDRGIALGQRNDKTKKIIAVNRLKSSNKTPKIRLVYNSFYTQTYIHLSHTYYYYNNIRDILYMHLVPVWLGAVLRTPYVHMYVPSTVRRPHTLITLHASPNWWLAGR